MTNEYLSNKGINNAGLSLKKTALDNLIFRPYEQIIHCLMHESLSGSITN